MSISVCSSATIENAESNNTAEIVLPINETNGYSQPTYELRERKPKNVKIVEQRTKSLKQIVAASQAALYTSKAIRIWESLKKKTVQEKIDLKTNDIVCARMSGHRPWPARIKEFKRNSIFVKFYGTQEEGIVKKSEIVPYDFCEEMISTFLKMSTSDLNNRSLMYHLSFVKACIELN